MYRLRTADKGRPLIIADKLIEAYADNNIDTLHKKNLLSLGEDRYLTTLMIKYFPQMSYKYLPDAYALTEAPATWSVLLSQRRRWINSTIHNLAEMIWIDHCGFCLFSMRFVVIIDLFGTLILPATLAYLIYLIYTVASHTGPLPLISLIMIAAVYGLQAIIFIVKRQWQHVGWMIIYIMAYPIWSLILPVYSFWKQDDFSWGNTRIVIGEKGDKQLVALDDEGFNPRSIPLQRWDDYALANSLPGRRGIPQEKEGFMEMYADAPGPGYEMDDMHSVYSSGRPASTILTGFPQQNQAFRPPQSPGPYNAMQPNNRHSTLSHLSRYTDNPAVAMDQNLRASRVMSSGNLSEHFVGTTPRNRSVDNLLQAGAQTPPAYPGTPGHQSMTLNRSSSAMQLSSSGLQGFQTQGPTNEAITLAIRECLAEVDLDNVTKKQLKALTEQRLQCQLGPEKRSFLDLQIDAELANMF
jgi:chitin synthase